MAAVVLDKDLLTIKGIRYILIEITLYFSHENRKITTLLDYGANEDLISQRFTKENGLETTPVKRIKTTVDRHHIIIYRFHNIIIKAKNSRNEVRATQRTFYIIDIVVGQSCCQAKEDS